MPKIVRNEEQTEMISFLIKKTRDAKSPLSIKQLARELETSGSSQGVGCLRSRIRRFRSKIHQMDSIDTKTKVKMLFALSAPIDENYLNELRIDAHVEVDGNNRITKYRAKDGSLELTGEHSEAAKIREKWKYSMARSGNLLEDSDDEDSIHRTPGSMKREAAAEVPGSSKRTRDSSPTPVIKTEDYDPDDSVRIPEFRACGFSPNTSNPEIQQLREPKLEDVPGAPIEAESKSNDAYTPRIKFLEAIHFLVFNLDMPNLSPLHAKIEMKLRESPNAQIPNEEMILAMEVLVTKITNHSVANLHENVDSVTLSNFLCYLKAAILNSKLEGLDDLLEKIKKRIKDPSLKFKNITVEKIAMVLRTTLDVIEF